jgi:hypothetical protein
MSPAETGDDSRIVRKSKRILFIRYFLQHALPGNIEEPSLTGMVNINDFFSPVNIDGLAKSRHTRESGYPWVL